ncbi:hypothetical protein LCGC14_0643810 [marine sediment metagenome]|uniref:Class I SAM-dependent methyltransferase n=1 Tax=marine sediment metagenome TaxID=412755 RepID=A0A0F9QYK0_9ZZZZ|nr:class I SAM-dependent methyltransferase [Pricia sp.]
MDLGVKQMEVPGYPQERILHLYPDEKTGIDIVGDEGYVEKVAEQFGKRCMRGTAVRFCGRNRTINCEPFLRRVFNRSAPQRAVEIGTLYGVTTALLAHYSESVVTIDIAYQQTASYLWGYFGVQPKIKYVIVKNDEDKKLFCDELFDEYGFDFAFIDAQHTFDGVRFDFECVKRCGRVLFHDYGLTNHTGVTEFIDTLPQNETTKMKPFAYWQRQ